jgi:pimeloyl-ACP methyl ester carboxylesterase
VPDSASSPTVVLVHGAFADASSWIGVITELLSDGLPVLAPPNPLRSLAGDAAYIAERVRQIEGSVLLVGHSYGGAVITVAGAAADNVVGLVYVAAFIPKEGECIAEIYERFPKPRLPEVLQPNRFPLDAAGESAVEFTIAPEAYPGVFAPTLGPDAAAAAAVSQRPLAASANEDKASAAAWRTLRSWAIVASRDEAIHPDAERSMADRADAETIEIPGPHTLMLSDPARVADHIRAALVALSKR